MTTIREEILEECRSFVSQNKGLTLNEEDHYVSPRISSEFMDCSMPMTFDSYSHCSLGCTYCFSYMFKSNNPGFRPGLRCVDHKALIKTLNGDPKGAKNKGFYKHFYSKRFLLHWGGLADPFCNFEKTNGIGYEIIHELARLKYPTLFSFKGSAIFRPNFEKLFSKYAHNKNFAFQISMVTGSNEMARDVEIGVQVPSKRIEAIKMLSDMGYYTILRLRPFIIGITDHGLDELLDKCLEAGIQGVSMEFFAMDMRSNEGLMKRYRWLQNLIGTKDILEYFKALSPSERGGYRRLNRLVKERFVKQVYTFCIKNNLTFGCSDPDFKELNTSGSCCGMPDNYPGNTELQNWTKSQLTYHLKEARRIFHTTGRVKKIIFDDVFDSEKDTYLDDPVFGQDHVTVVGKTTSERHDITYKRIALEKWNNLRTATNPRNYFHGKMMPIAIDTNGTLIYKYAPSEYEERWKKEKIDLAR